MGIAFPARSVAVADGVQAIAAAAPTVVTVPTTGAPSVSVIAPPDCVIVDPLNESVLVV